jgi:hypothetical protein
MNTITITSTNISPVLRVIRRLLKNGHFSSAPPKGTQTDAYILLTDMTDSKQKHPKTAPKFCLKTHLDECTAQSDSVFARFNSDEINESM